MRLSTVVRFDVVGRPEGGGDVRPLSPKQFIPICHYVSGIGAVSGGREATGSAGDQ